MSFYDLKPRGIIFDFDGVFTSNTVYVSEDGSESVRCSRFDGLGLQLLRRLEIPMIVISTEKNPIVSVRCQKLKIECVQDCDDKVLTAQHWASSKQLSLSDILFLGNDVNDLPLLNMVGYSCCVADSWAPVQKQSDYILKRAGGNGAVRELCDQIFENLSQYKA